MQGKARIWMEIATSRILYLASKVLGGNAKVAFSQGLTAVLRVCVFPFRRREAERQTSSLLSKR